MPRKFPLLTLLLALIATALGAMDSDDGEIVVRLATESRLLPVYLSEVTDTDKSLPAEYVQELAKVLEFDLRHNGMMELLPRNRERERLVNSVSFDTALSQKDWKDRQVFYVIRPQVSSKGMVIRIAFMSTGVLKGLSPVTLTGKLPQDRRRIHQLADAIHQTIFGKRGIASTRILYTVRKPNPNPNGTHRWLSEVWEADWDGKNAVQVTHDGSYCVTPCYLPPKAGYNSGSFFYVSYRTGQPKIHMASLRDGDNRSFTRLRGNQLMPVSNKNRDLVAFVCDAGGNPDLFVQPYNPELGAMGKPYQIYANRRGTQASPAFSPDGRRVAFVSNKDGPTRIYVMDVPAPGARAKDLRPQAITRINRENTAPSWSPDGSKLAYSSRAGGVRQIWIYDFATGQERQLTQGRGNKENPTWAPDSLHLLFNSAEPGSSELYVVNLNQPQVVKISSGPGEKRFPDWEPRS